MRLANAGSEMTGEPLGRPEPSLQVSFPPPLRVLHVMWSGDMGGAERAVYQLVREQLRDSQLSPGLLFARGEGQYWDLARELGCPVIGLGLPHGHAIGHLRDAARAMRPYQIHHFHSAEPLLMLASLQCRRARRIYTHRGGSRRYSPKKRLRYALCRPLIRRAFHGLSGNTRHGAQAAARLFNLDQESFLVTYNGLEFDLLEPRRAADDVRLEHGLDPADFVLGTAAHIRRWKRIDRLLAAVGAIRDPALKLLVVGEGGDLPRLRSLAQELSLTGQVLFVGKQAHIGDYLQVMDAFCLPSTTMESFGNAAVEAMAMAVPTIVFSDAGGMLEHVENEETGFIVSSQLELEETIRRLQRDPLLRKEIGERGRASVRRRYTLAESAQAYRELYASATSRWSK